MKIKSLKISNILSFEYRKNIDDATEIIFDPNLNILIGQNGSGKSTALEVINFIFKRILGINYIFDNHTYINQVNLSPDDRKQTIQKQNKQTFSEFRLSPNWSSENLPSKIKLEIELDEIDEKNISFLKNNEDKLSTIATTYSHQNLSINLDYKKKFIIDIDLNRNNSFNHNTSAETDIGIRYLIDYNYYKVLIDLYNLDNSTSKIEQLHESFALISSYRNYHSFSSSVSLQEQEASTQISEIKNSDFSKSLNIGEQHEPSIFNLVRLRIAQVHFNLFNEAFTNEKKEEIANNQAFLLAINDKLKLINLRVAIKLHEPRFWSYSFNFIDIKKNKTITDINSLSAGQKSIIHLIFEAYGRGQLSGGLVIIDEPEIHLHHQFQDEYIRILESINKEQGCQYILVTHSESLINSTTIDKVQRFALDDNNHTFISRPNLTAKQKILIKILDNTRAAYAFFASKILLVEGDTDRYFFKSIFQNLHPELNQSLAILYMNGKGSFEDWKDFFLSFGLKVYYIGDFDNIFTLKFNGNAIIDKSQKSTIETQLKLTKLQKLTSTQQSQLKTNYNNLIKDADFLVNPNSRKWRSLVDCYKNLERVDQKDIIQQIKDNHSTINQIIESKYSEHIYILKEGAIEAYTNTSHGNIEKIIDFCNNDLDTYLKSKEPKVEELKNIINCIIND